MRVNRTNTLFCLAPLALLGCSKGAPAEAASERVSSAEPEDHRGGLVRIDEVVKKREALATSCEKAVVDLAGHLLPEGMKAGPKQAPAKGASLSGFVPFSVSLDDRGKPRRATRIDGAGNPAIAGLGARVDAAATDCEAKPFSSEELVTKARNARYVVTSSGMNQVAEEERLAKAALEDYAAHPLKPTPPDKVLLAWDRCWATEASTYKSDGLLGSTQDFDSYACLAGYLWVTGDGRVVAAASGSGTASPEARLKVVRVGGELATNVDGQTEEAARRDAFAKIWPTLTSWPK